MLLANSLKEKIKNSYFENDADFSNKPKFPFQEPSLNPKAFISFKPLYKVLPENKITTQLLRAMDKKTWEAAFSLHALKSEWKNKVNLEFNLKYKKFPNEILSEEVKKAQSFVKEFRDPDILELHQKRWNISSDVNTKVRPELKQTLFEVNNGLQDFKIVPIKEHSVQEGVDSRDHLLIDGNQWNSSNFVNKAELEAINQMEKNKASLNSAKYWSNNESNRQNEEAFPISEQRKKIEVIRYFQKYRSPTQKFVDCYNAMQKAKSLTIAEHQKVSKNIQKQISGIKSKELINALIFKEMYNIQKQKFNELTGKLDKGKMKKNQLEKNKFVWKDADLIDKMTALSKLDIAPLKQEFFKGRNKNAVSQDNLRSSILKSLVIKGKDIQLEQEKIKEELENQFKKQKQKEIFLNQKLFKKKIIVNKSISRYPMNKSTLNELNCRLEKIEDEKPNLNMSLSLNNIHSNMGKNQCDALFLNAYKNVLKKDFNSKSLYSSKSSNEIVFEYKHPGTYREFDIYIPESSDTLSEDISDRVIKQKLWSCCMNADINSKGCMKIPIKDFQWIYKP